LFFNNHICTYSNNLDFDQSHQQNLKKEEKRRNNKKLLMS
jgi:hypothetical protein